MSDRDRAEQGHGERDRAVERLEQATSQQSRLRGEREAAKDTPGEITVDAALRVANDQVAARERWLRSVDDQEY